MTEHSLNAQFHASSFLQGHNGEYVGQLHARPFEGKCGAEDKIEAVLEAIG